ncbi:uncharacterized protein DSM5745_08594 [Aspergillus mulundensis]|uniref:Uncharacterized protein n=1 Tax=Aspergillus mulundensis TaxID=1810919 RepID=A0A3D8R4U6_9EURO|nr:Uncharacterized protein DSM5745_08594 [Aspergillus mulundensis]RDW68834.1 Uncharacterized protein DSM5745_08594 [Aspergillus mulundensis]
MRLAALAIASLAMLASASPSARANAVYPEKRAIDSITITFYTETGSWSQTLPTDLSSFEIDNLTTVTKIYNPGGAICGFSGTEGGYWTVHIGETVLEDPQPLKSGFCDDL